MRIFSGIRASGRKTLGNYSGGYPAIPGDAGPGRGLLLHRRPALDHDGLRAAGASRRDARGRRDALRDGHRPRPLDRLRPEPRHRPRRGGLAARLGHELRRASPDDPVQGEVRGAGLRLRGALQLPGPDGRRHPALPDRPRPDRRRPAPAPRAHARRCRALQPALRRDVHDPGGGLPRRGRAHQEPPGARAADVDDARRGAGSRAHDRPARRDPAQVQDGGHRFRHRRPPRARGEAGHLEPAGDHVRGDRRRDP